MANSKKAGSKQSPNRINSVEEFERRLRNCDRETYVLQLYVSGTGRISANAVENVNALCASHLAGRFQLEVIDIRLQPALAQEADIVATPTLFRKLPEPVRRFIGDLTDHGGVLQGLKIIAHSSDPEKRS